MAQICPISPDSLQRAKAIIASGGLVAFPTETVYGLGADALQEDACKKIYKTKGRPSNNPLIVHTDSFKNALSLTSLTPNTWQHDAFVTLGKLWPAPLTLVVPAASLFPKTVTAGLPTVALRVPQSQAALKFLQAVHTPIAAPSANRSSYVSPTTAQHVADDLGEDLELILDSGETQFGLESTIVSIGERNACLLRPGALTYEELKELIPELTLAKPQSEQETPSAPGQLALHYSPHTPIYLREDAPSNHSPSHTALISFSATTQEENTDYASITTLSDSKNLNDVARKLYAALRSLDTKGLDAIIVDTCERDGIGRAIMDRLERASAS